MKGHPKDLLQFSQLFVPLSRGKVTEDDARHENTNNIWFEFIRRNQVEYLPSEILTLAGGNLSLVLEIALVTYDNHGNLVLVLNTENLLPEGGDLIKTASGGDRVYLKMQNYEPCDVEYADICGENKAVGEFVTYTKETLTGSHVLVTHG